MYKIKVISWQNSLRDKIYSANRKKIDFKNTCGTCNPFCLLAVVVVVVVAVVVVVVDLVVLLVFLLMLLMLLFLLLMLLLRNEHWNRTNIKIDKAPTHKTTVDS